MSYLDVSTTDLVAKALEVEVHSSTDKLVLVVLAGLSTGEPVKVPLRVIGKHAQLGLPAVWRAVHRLADWGIISITQANLADGNRYTLFPNES